MSEAENKVADAVETVAAAEEAQAEAAALAASALATEKVSEAAETAVAAANAGAALAAAEAAKTINENEQDLSWLKQHAVAVEDSLKNQQTQISGLQTEMQTNYQAILTGLQSLTRPPSPEPETSQTVNPQSQSAQEEGPKDSVPPKKKRRFI